jgi:hypothetical protein
MVALLLGLLLATEPTPVEPEVEERAELQDEEIPDAEPVAIPPTWVDRADLVGTLAVYGLVAGYGLTPLAPFQPYTPILGGALLFGFAGALLNVTQDQVPLVEGLILLPATLLVLLLAVLNPYPDPWYITTAIAVAGGLCLPLGLVVGTRLKISGGDAALIRDAGFWGALLGTLLGMGSTTGIQPLPTLIGLLTGTGAGAVLSRLFEPTLGQVRAVTVSGYLGGMLGLIGILIRQSSAGPGGLPFWPQQIALGAAGGMVIATEVVMHLDYLDEETALQPAALPLLPHRDQTFAFALGIRAAF